ncbi:hypothetical protein ACWIGX_27340 [Streptomyces nigrescens]
MATPESYAQIGRHGSPLAARRSPLAARRSPLAARRSPLAARRSPLSSTYPISSGNATFLADRSG